MHSSNTASDVLTTGYFTSSTICPSCGSSYYGGWHVCYWAWPTYPVTYCGRADNHDFTQAEAPFQDVLFCRRCGETKALKLARAQRKTRATPQVG